MVSSDPMSRSPIALVALLLLLRAPAAAKEPPPERCSLFETRFNPEDPIARRGVFRNAFAKFGANQYAAATKSFESAMRGIADEVDRYFHPKKDATVSNDRIQRFLKEYVTGKSPVLTVAEDDFVYVPTVLLALAESQCRTGDIGGARLTLAPLEASDDGRVRPARAVLALEAGEPGEALRILGTAEGQEPLGAQLVRAATLSKLRRFDDAWAVIDAARAACVGEEACARVEAVRRDLVGRGDQ